MINEAKGIGDFILISKVYSDDLGISWVEFLDKRI